MRIMFNPISFNSPKYKIKSDKYQQQNSSAITAPMQNKIYLPSLISFKGSSRNDMDLLKNMLSVINKSENIQDEVETIEGRKDFGKNPLLDELIALNSQNPLNSESPALERDEVLSYLNRKSADKSDEFVASTYGAFIDPKSTNSEKLKGFQIAFKLIEEKISKMNPEEAQNINIFFDRYKETISHSINKGHTIYAQNDTKKIFALAKTYWEKKYLPKLIDTEIEKMIFVEKSIQKCPTLGKLKTFNNLALDDKYLVAQYYKNNNYMVYKDDPMQAILKDRTIYEKSIIIGEIRQKLELESEIFIEKTSDIDEKRKDPDGIMQLSDYEITGKNRDEDISLLDLYLSKINKKNILFANKQAKADFLAEADTKDLDMATTEILEDWANKYLLAKLDKEVDYQAYKTDIQVRIKDELVSINKNLDNINIKLDKMTISLADLVANSNGIVAKLNNPVADSIELQKKSSLKIDEMKYVINKLDDDDKSKILEAFKTNGIAYLNVVLANTKDAESNRALNELKTTITTAKTPNAVMSRLESFGTLGVMNSILHSGHGALPQAVDHAVDSAVQELTHPDTFASFTTHPAMAHPAIHHADKLKKHAGEGAAISSVLQSTILAAVIMGIYGVYKSVQVHKSFSDMYFGE